MKKVRISVIYIDNKVDKTKQICSTTVAEIPGYNEKEPISDEMAYTLAISLAKSHTGHNDIVYISHNHSLENETE